MRRVLSAAVLVAVLAAAVWLLPIWVTAALAAVAAGLAACELAHMGAAIGAGVPPAFTGAAAAVLSLAFFTAFHGGRADPGALAAVLLALIVASGVVALAVGAPEPATVTRAALLVFAPVYVGIPLGVIAVVQSTAGPAATTWLVAVIAVSDSAQYYTGRAFGRRKLAPAVSPAKTIEGAVGGVAVAAAAGAALGAMCLHVPVAEAGALALILALAGIAGDLFESLLKRSAGVKDSSALIPGHGGVLDRIDSHLFAAPVFYLFLRYVA